MGVQMGERIDRKEEEWSMLWLLRWLRFGFFLMLFFFFFMELMDNGEGFAYERWLTVKKALLVQRKTLISLDTM